MKTLRVLLIEDDADDALIIQDMLNECQELRFQVRVSDTVGAGVALLRQEPPDLILLDLSLPDSVGLEGLKQVRSVAPAVNVIILTGCNDNRMGLESLKQGANDYLVKGRIDSNLLVRTILFSQERRRLEDQLRQAQKVEAIGRLAGGIAHDFNNQLGIMTLLTAEIAAQNKDAKVQNSLTDLTSVVDKCGHLVKKILAFSRQQVLSPEVLDIVKVCDELIPLMQRMVGQQIRISFAANCQTCAIKIDKTQFEQVLWNLVINAKDAIGKQGEIKIRVTLANEKVLLEVADNGPGIPKEILPKIFDPFFTTKPVGEGTGLGLATVIGILHQSGAKVEVISEEGQGACFQMTFPAVREKVPEKIVTHQTVANVGPKTALVCDDEEMLLDLMVNILERAGMTILKAPTARHAIEIFKNHKEIELVVTDLTMPEMDGRRLGEELLKIRPGFKLIFVSGYSEGLPEMNAMGDDVRYLSKPFSKQSLLSVVNDIFKPKP